MDRFPRSDSIVQPRAGLQTYMAQVYGWMTVGLLLTAFVAWYAANSAAVMELLFTNRVFLIGLIIAQLALVIVLSAMIQKLSAGVTTMLFMLYSALTGLTLSSIFIVYTAASIASTFVVTAGMFGAMSLYGYTTKRDLSGFGNMLFMALIGIVLASLVNFWLKSEALMWAVTYIGVIVFVGLTAYDTQKLKNMGEQIDTRDTSNLRKYSILGALTLYLDFINLFLMLLRIFGNRANTHIFRTDDIVFFNVFFDNADELLAISLRLTGTHTRDILKLLIGDGVGSSHSLQTRVLENNERRHVHLLR